MTIKRTLVAVGTAVALTACSAATRPAQAPTTLARASCGGIADLDQEVSNLYASGVTRVDKLYLDDPKGAAPNTRAGTAQPARYMAGATLYVPAERGVSSAYLERVLSCHAAGRTASGHDQDPLRVAGVQDVNVREAGPELRIAIAGANADAGEAILQRARALSSRSGRVEVQQLSAAETVGGAF